MRAGDTLVLLQHPVPGAANFRGHGVDVHHAFVAPPAAGGSLLTCTLVVPGAAAGADAPWRYIVQTDVQPDFEAEFNAWYDEEHLPALAAVPGCVQASRWLVDGAGPRYLACYDLATLDTYGSTAWLAVRATPWSSRIRPAFCNTLRTMFARV